MNRGEAWFDLAWAQQRARRFDDALASYRQALAAGLSAPAQAHLNRAAILAQHLGRDGEAEAEVQAALAADPQCVAAWLNLGQLHERAGRREPAQAAYAAALAVEPGHALALARLAGVSPPAEALRRRLQAALAQPGRSAEEQADLGFALGRALDAAGRWDAAFDAIAAAHAHDHVARPGRYDPMAHEAWVDRVLALPPPAAPAPPARPLVFVCGLHRSGSTLAERILARHPRVTAAGELDLLPVLARQHRGEPGPIRSDYLQGLAARFPRADVLVDKRPDNFLLVGLILALFGGAKIVHTRRDARDNALALWFTHLGPAMAWSRDLGHVAHWMQQHNRLMAHWRRTFPGAIHELDYDRLVHEPRHEIARLLGFLGLPWHDDCLQPHEGVGTVDTPSTWQVREALHTRSSGRSRPYAARLAAWF